MTVNNESPSPRGSPRTFSTFYERILRDLTNKVADAGWTLIENGLTPPTPHARLEPRSASEPIRKIQPMSSSSGPKTPAWEVVLGDENKPPEEPTESKLSPELAAVPPTGVRSDATERAKLKACLESVQFPAEVIDVFVSNVIPPGSLRTFTADAANCAFRIELVKEHKGQIKGVTQEGFDKLNGKGVTMSNVIAGTYDPTTKSISFSQGISVQVGWGVSTQLTGLKVVKENGEDMIKVETSVMSPAGSNSKFAKTFGPANLTWT